MRFERYFTSRDSLSPPNLKNITFEYVFIQVIIYVNFMFKFKSYTDITCFFIPGIVVYESYR